MEDCTTPSADEEYCLEQPALPLPQGEVQDFINPVNRNGLEIVLIDVCITILTFFGIIRSYAKISCTKRVRLEDCKLLA